MFVIGKYRDCATSHACRSYSEDDIIQVRKYNFYILKLVCVDCCFIAVLLHLLDRKALVDNDDGVKMLESTYI